METTLRLNKRTRSTLVKMAGTALEFLPMTGAPSDGGPGRKLFFPIPLKNKPNCMEDFLYVFAESKLPVEPKDRDLGFTEDDITDSTGIYLFNQHGDQSCGQVFPLETLFEEVFTDLSLRNRVMFKLDEMKKIVHLDDDFLDAANTDRVTHSPSYQEFVQYMRLH
jgi:hypothetical protein